MSEWSVTENNAIVEDIAVASYGLYDGPNYDDAGADNGKKFVTGRQTFHRREAGDGFRDLNPDDMQQWGDLREKIRLYETIWSNMQYFMCAPYNDNCI